MHRKHLVTLLATGFAAGVVAWLVPARSVAAGSPSGSVAEVDSDNDFLPDAVEWVLLTNSLKPDTDGDTISDFVEVVAAAHPRHASMPEPPDQQMRLVITGPSPATTDPRTWMHIFHRVMTSESGAGAGVMAIESFDTWLERPEWAGLRIPLNMFAAGGIVYKERVTATEGVWVQLSIPLVSEQILEAVLPCTIWAETTVAGRSLASGMKLIDVPDGIATFVPYDSSRFVMQTLTQTSGGMDGREESNRVCVIEMAEESSGPAGTTYIITAADCEDANELECSASCPDCVGWSVTIPGGTDLLGGR